MQTQMQQQLLSGPHETSLRSTRTCFGTIQPKKVKKARHHAPSAGSLAPACLQQQQRCSMLALQAAKSGAVATSFLTDNPVGKALSGLVGTPVFWGMEVVALLVMLGLTDAGYSGDWSRIGAITKDTELLLQKLAIVAWSLHGVTGIISANIASSKGRSPAVAAVKGVLFGSLHVFEELVLPPVTGQTAKATPADSPAGRR